MSRFQCLYNQLRLRKKRKSAAEIRKELVSDTVPPKHSHTREPKREGIIEGGAEDFGALCEALVDEERVTEHRHWKLEELVGSGHYW